MLLLRVLPVVRRGDAVPAAGSPCTRGCIALHLEHLDIVAPGVAALNGDTRRVGRLRGDQVGRAFAHQEKAETPEGRTDTRATKAGRGSAGVHSLGRTGAAADTSRKHEQRVSTESQFPPGDARPRPTRTCSRRLSLCRSLPPSVSVRSSVCARVLVVVSRLSADAGEESAARTRRPPAINTPDPTRGEREERRPAHWSTLVLPAYLVCSVCARRLVRFSSASACSAGFLSPLLGSFGTLLWQRNEPDHASDSDRVGRESRTSRDQGRGNSVRSAQGHGAIQYDIIRPCQRHSISEISSQQGFSRLRQKRETDNPADPTLWSATASSVLDLRSLWCLLADLIGPL